jgi:hypothetical protein
MPRQKALNETLAAISRIKPTVMKNLFKSLDKKNAILVMGIPVIIILVGGIIMYDQSRQQTDTGRSAERGRSAAIIPAIGVEEPGTQGTSKVAAYNDYNREQESENRRRTMTVSNRDFFDIGNNAAEPQEQPPSGLPAAPPPVQPAAASGRARPVEQEQIVLEDTEIPPLHRGSLGVYQAQARVVQQQQNEKEFIPAFLEKDQKVEHNSPVVFLLEKDIVIKGIFFRRHSIMYGQGISDGNRIQIQVTRIKNYADGQTHNIRLAGFDENYVQGIAPAAASRSTQRAAGDVAAETANAVGSVTGLGRVVGTGVRREGQDRARTLEVSLAQGYRMQFVEN